TGYSSLSYLQRFPLQILKIDRSFVRDMTVNKNSEALVEAIISMAGSLELDIVAEGVEEQEQIDFLGQRGVHTIQGYFFSPPVPAAAFREMLKRQGDGEPVDRVFSSDGR
ncbi:MAG: EAL domain-containing protein, partial [Desulfobulbaceae bacterium]|nr:EAL domain-containing protein [Desulfobulbaceae bacterium]